MNLNEKRKMIADAVLEAAKKGESLIEVETREDLKILQRAWYRLSSNAANKEHFALSVEPETLTIRIFNKKIAEAVEQSTKPPAGENIKIEAGQNRKNIKPAKMTLSVVVPVFNEARNIRPLIGEIQKALRNINYELIIVDDGSTDDTAQMVEKFADKKTRLVIFNRNYGQSQALAAGIEIAEGELIAMLDGDLQNDPRDIPKMMRKLGAEKCDVVAGNRVNRQDNAILRKIPSRVANFIIRTLTGIRLHDYGCTLKIFKRAVAKNLGLYGELHRFIPVLAKLYGAKIIEMAVHHRPRKYGRSKYGISRLPRVFSDLMLMVFLQKYGARPMHLFGMVGFSSFFIGFAIATYLFILKILGESIGGRPLFMVGILLILGGIMMVMTGFLAEIMMRTYYESQEKKPYVVNRLIRGKNDGKLEK